LTGLPLPKVECVENTDRYGRFVAEPLERGFGVTLGNSLRRVLLSSLPGAAITWVRIDGVQHEFSTIPHVKEDAVDFLLNVKAVRVRPLSHRSGVLKLEVQREGEVTAADIKPTADFEIANPNIHLATLDSRKARFSVEFNVEIGRGYVPARSGDSLAIGTIPIDAIFSPVYKANYSVEPSSLREGSNEEKLTLEVWTDGTLSPTEAVIQSAAMLVEQFIAFRDLAKGAVEEKMESTWQNLIPAEQYSLPIDQLNLSTHTYNSLRRGGVATLGQILEQGVGGLSALAGFGAKSREELEATLQGLGLPAVPEAKDKKEKKKRKQPAASVSAEAEDEASAEGKAENEASGSRKKTK